MAEQYNPFTYLAVGQKPTHLRKFFALSGDIEPVAKTEFADGFDALAYRWKDGLLYAMSRKSNTTLVVIDPAKGKVSTKAVEGMPSQGGTWVLGAMHPDGDRYVITGSDPNSSGAVLDLSSDPVKATAQNAPGGGGWYDWAYHPADGRLYAVDGSDGALLYADPDRTPQKTVLKTGVFPKVTKYRYTALFFDKVGWLYAIDTDGNVFRTDLRSSTASKPITPEKVTAAVRVGGGPINVDGLDVVDAGGDITEQKIDPVYARLVTPSQTLRGKWDEEHPKKVTVFSFRVTLCAKLHKGNKPVAVRKWRLLFDRASADDTVVCPAAKVTIRHADNSHVLDTPGEDHFIEAGQELPVDLQVKVPREHKVNLTKLSRLTAHRIA